MAGFEILQDIDDIKASLSQKSIVASSTTNGKIKVNNVDVSVYDDTAIVSNLANNVTQLATKRDITSKIKDTDMDTSTNTNKLKAINMADELMLMFSPAGTVSPVIADGGVGTTKYADNSITYKKSKYIEGHLITMTAGVKPITINWQTKTISFAPSFYIFIDEVGIYINTAQPAIDMTSIVYTNGICMCYWDLTLQQFKIALSYQMPDTSKIIMFYFWSNEIWSKNRDFITFISADGTERSVSLLDNGISTDKLKYYDAYILHPNIATINYKTNQITFANVAFNIIYGKTAITMAIGTPSIDISALNASVTICICYYDFTSNTIKACTYNNLPDVKKLILFQFWSDNIIAKNKEAILLIKANGLDYKIPSRHSGKTMCCLGDSITWGYTPISGVQMPFPYPTIVKEMLGLATITNYGIAGSTLGSLSDGSNNPMTRRFSSMASADIVTFMGGVNDLAKGVPLGVNTDTTDLTYYGALNVLCSGLIDKYPSALIIGLTPSEYFSMDVKPYVNAFKEVCYKYSIPCFDLYGNSGITPFNATQKALYMPDGTHFMPDGQVKLGQKIAGFINAQ